MDPRVSIVIPVHNRAQLVARAIRSALAQTFADHELIVVDDGSTDALAEAVQTFDDPRIRLVRLPAHRGLGAARNAGIQEAGGEWVAFLDSDDEWLPEKLERQLARARASAGASVVYCPFLRRNDATRRLAPPDRTAHEGDVFRALVRGWNPLSSCLLIERSALAGVGGLDESLPSLADYDLCLRLATASHRFAAVPEPLVVKHEHGVPQISSDPVALRQGVEALDRKWRAELIRRFGSHGYRRWRARLRASVFYVQVRQAVARGERIAAWRHWLAMCRLAPWAPGFVAYGLALATLGLAGYEALARARDGLRQGLRQGRFFP